MKKISLLLLVFVLGTNLADATPITPGAAQKIAEKFYTQYSTQIPNSTSLAYTDKSSSNGNAVFYVFNVNDNDGYVIVSADDAGNSIINYSTHGKFAVPMPKASVVTIEKWDTKNWASPSFKS